MQKQKPAKKWGGGGFVAMPHRVLDSPKFATLSANAAKLLLDLLSQYRGRNNGDLCAAMTLMDKRGWTSKSALQGAKNELLESGFITMTRQGGRNKPTLYALTFYSVDECTTKGGISRHDAKPTLSPSDNWLRDVPALDIQEAQRRKKKNDIERNIAELTEELEDDPNHQYAENIRATITEDRRKLAALGF